MSSLQSINKTITSKGAGKGRLFKDISMKTLKENLHRFLQSVKQNKVARFIISRGYSGRVSDHEIMVLERQPASRWEWIEHLKDQDPHFYKRNFHRRGVHRNEEIVKAFETPMPHSGNVLLHFAGTPRGRKSRVPVILVHGANGEADFWLNGWNGDQDGGLASYLKERGFMVYAVTFAHSHDDNFFWAQQVANVIQRVKKLTGASKVDIISHSKGGIPVRCYVSDFREPWMTPYQNDVRRVIFIGVPHGGIDLSFRHPVCNLALFDEENESHLLNAPMSWNKMVKYGIVHDVSTLGFDTHGPDFWPGQRQILARWDGSYELPLWEVDMHSTYQGGHGLMSESRGIDYYIAQGGNFMEELGKRPIHPSVEVALLAGNRADIQGILNEYTGPSDGLLFVESALKVPRGTRIGALEVMPLNHLTLVADEKAKSWISSVLTQRRLPVLKKREIALKTKKAIESATVENTPWLSDMYELIPSLMEKVEQVPGLITGLLKPLVNFW